MAKAYSEDMRKRVIDKKNQGKTTKEIMEDLLVSQTFVYNVLRNYRLTNQMIEKQPDSTLEEIKETLDLNIAISTLFYIIRDYLHFWYKKNSTRKRTT